MPRRPASGCLPPQQEEPVSRGSLRGGASSLSSIPRENVFCELERKIGQAMPNEKGFQL